MLDHGCAPLRTYVSRAYIHARPTARAPQTGALASRAAQNGHSHAQICIHARHHSRQTESLGNFKESPSGQGLGWHRSVHRGQRESPRKLQGSSRTSRRAVPRMALGTAPSTRQMHSW
eukprot:6202325-Pleurochrysis_carterae.AAC.2